MSKKEEYANVGIPHFIWQEDIHFIIAAWPLVVLYSSFQFMLFTRITKRAQLEDYLVRSLTMYLTRNRKKSMSIDDQRNGNHYIRATVDTLGERDTQINSAFSRELFGIVIIDSGDLSSNTLQALTSCLFIRCPWRRRF